MKIPLLFTATLAFTLNAQDTPKNGIPPAHPPLAHPDKGAPSIPANLQLEYWKKKAVAQDAEHDVEQTPQYSYAKAQATDLATTMNKINEVCGTTHHVDIDATSKDLRCVENPKPAPPAPPAEKK